MLKCLINQWPTYADYLLKGDKGWVRKRWAKKQAKDEAKFYDCKTFSDGVD